MAKHRDRVVVHAGLFWDKLQAVGFDFRMAVAGMDPRLPGKLCSVSSQDPAHAGGADRFLKSSERSQFLGCVRNPARSRARATGWRPPPRQLLATCPGQTTTRPGSAPTLAWC